MSHTVDNSSHLRGAAAPALITKPPTSTATSAAEASVIKVEVKSVQKMNDVEQLKLMSEQQKNNPLHGITLEMILNRLVDFYGWDKLGNHIKIKCFNSEIITIKPINILVAVIRFLFTFTYLILKKLNL